jgi:hypothetical protein
MLRSQPDAQIQPSLAMVSRTFVYSFFVLRSNRQFTLEKQPVSISSSEKADF